MVWCGDGSDARKRTPRDHASGRPDRRFADLAARQPGSEAGRPAGRQRPGLTRPTARRYSRRLWRHVWTDVRTHVRVHVSWARPAGRGSMWWETGGPASGQATASARDLCSDQRRRTSLPCLDTNSSWMAPSDRLSSSLPECVLLTIPNSYRQLAVFGR